MTLQTRSEPQDPGGHMEATVREYIEAQLALEAMIVLLDLMLADIHDQLWDVDGQAQLVRHSYGEGA